jgi:SAM-dependent methyltransferase
VGYLNVIYSKNRRPYTSYPSKLCKFIVDNYFKKDYETILDVGCGRGEHLSEFQKLGFHIKGIDKSEEAKELMNNIQIVDLDHESIPFDDNSFDVIFNKSLIEHLNNPDNFFQEAYRILKPGGRLITLTPDWESVYKIFYEDYTHKTPFTIDAIKDIYQIFRFKLIVVKKFRQLPILWKYPSLTIFSKLLFYLPRSKNKAIKFSKELMLLGVGEKIE